MPSPSACVILLTRYPRAGTTKTRLIPLLGAEGAAALQRRMTERTLQEARALARSRAVAVRVAHEGGDGARMRAWLGNSVTFVPQRGADLGERIFNAMREALDAGHRRVILVGTDHPTLSARIMGDALDALARSDVVLGPTADGGYYLIGLVRAVPELFAGIPWSTETVLERTRAAAAAQGLEVACTRTLVDIDRPEDLAACRNLDWSPCPPPADARISVVIPALNEAARVADTIARVRTAPDVEVLVVDGGSTDGTAALAESCGARVIHGERGRARQSNAGAAAAQGEVLLFLHADTLLPTGYDREVRSILARPGVAAGAFKLRLEPASPALDLIAFGANLRARAFGLPYGDQGLFLSAQLFRAMGGFPPIPIMEDFVFVRHLARRGRVGLARGAVASSARRWQTLGPLKTTLVNQAVILGYHLGVPPEKLAAWYWRRRAR